MVMSAEGKGVQIIRFLSRSSRAEMCRFDESERSAHDAAELAEKRAVLWIAHRSHRLINRSRADIKSITHS